MLFEAACVEPIGTAPAILLFLLVWLPHIEAASLALVLQFLPMLTILGQTPLFLL